MGFNSGFKGLKTGVMSVYWACAVWPHARQSAVGRWVRRVRQCKKSAKNWYSVASQLMLCREIIAVCSQIHKKHINTVCGQNVELWNFKLVVCIVNTGFHRVNNKAHSTLLLHTVTVLQVRSYCQLLLLTTPILWLNTLPMNTRETPFVLRWF